jgi:hypothetical protein
VRGALLVVLLGCGRVGFDATVAAAHDEDGDGVPDLSDDCPFLADPQQADRDHDGVGDACDPEPDLPRQQLRVFAPMTGDVPCHLFSDDGVPWMQQADSVDITGSISAGLDCPFPIADTDIWVGFDLAGVHGLPHQFALDIRDPTTVPWYYGEIYDDGGGPHAAISEYDGTSYMGLAATSMPALHAGTLTDHLTTRTAATGTAQFRIDIGWPGEPYNAQGATTAFSGVTSFALYLQNLDVSIRYLAIIDTVP